jgi:hypothetical protein
MAVVAALNTISCAPATSQGTTPAGPARPASTLQTLASVTAAVLADAASRTGLEQTTLIVQSAEEVTWADGSLGCPAPGMSYTMALVPGYRIKVRAGGQVLDYHASRRGDFFVCPAGRAIDPAGPVAS